MYGEGEDGSWDSQLHALNGFVPSDGSNEAVEEGREEIDVFCMKEEVH